MLLKNKTYCQLSTDNRHSRGEMFKVVYRSNNSRRIQYGIRDLKITKWKCLRKAFVEAIKSFCTISSFAPLRLAFQRKRNKIDV